MAKQTRATYRAIFCLAAAYNVGFAVVSGCFPRAFFGAFGMGPDDYPANWPVVSLVVGVFGGLYVYAAWRPERGDVAIAIGLASKVLGPVGWLASVAGGRMSSALFPILLVGDILWWFPLLFYLLRKSRWQRPAIAWTAIGLHLVANFGLLLAAPGTEMEPDIADRQSWIAGHVALWTVTWVVWSASSISLLAFCAAWVSRLHELLYVNFWTICGVAVVAGGVGFDLCGETLLIVRATQPELSVEQFAHVTRLYQFLSPAIANGLYCVGGLLLSAVSRHVGWPRGTTGILGFAMWSVGFVLTLATLVDHRLGMVMSGAGVMLLFMPWAALVGWRMRAGVDRGASDTRRR